MFHATHTQLVTHGTKRVQVSHEKAEMSLSMLHERRTPFNDE